jgi:hypothetical protein
MKYILLCYHSEHASSDTDKERYRDEAVALCHELQAAGKYLAASPLRPVETATSVRIRDGKRLVTDGPFAETREQLGGYFLVDARDMDEAIDIAGRVPGARLGTVEIRPILELPAAG